MRLSHDRCACRWIRASATVIAVTTVLIGGCGNSTDANTSSKSCVDTSGSTIKVGSLNSVSGTMAAGEVAVRDAIKLAVDRINAQGGVLGKHIRIVDEDGASDPRAFAAKAETLVGRDCVAAVFGGSTSASRKAMLPVFEANNALLYYPAQDEGLESSKSAFYTGATTNQQIVPALDYLKRKGIKSLYLVGSGHVFAQTANRIIKAYARSNDIDIVGEDYAPVGSTDFSTIVATLRSSAAAAVFNTLDGDSNVAFFREYNNAGLSARTAPVVSSSIGEDDVANIGGHNVAGQLTARNYYQSVDNPVNKQFVADYKATYGQDKATSGAMEAGYVSVYLWKATVEKAKSFDVKAIQDNCDGVSFDAPEGIVTIDGSNHHVAKTARVGEIHPDGVIGTVWESPAPIGPDPYLKSYSWASALAS